MKVSFVLLAHEKPEQLKGLIVSLLRTGSDVFLHHDLQSPFDMSQASSEWGLEELPGQLYLAERIKVDWGMWSIVQATLNCLELIKQQNYSSDYYMLISGSCLPVKPVAQLQDYLSRSQKDHIEAVDAVRNRWVTGGIQEERWQYNHFFNFRSQRIRFELSLKLQRLFGIKRKVPLQHTPHMGSQWWCLRGSTIKALVEEIDNNPQLIRFYQRTWIPDELFFQTLVAKLIPENERDDRLLIRYKFNSWGIPRVYYDDDYAELLAEESFFVRKVSHRASGLRAKLESIAAMGVDVFAQHKRNSVDEYNYLLNKLSLDKRITSSRWYSIASAAENEYEYVASIPNKINVIVSSDEALNEKLQGLIEKDPDSYYLMGDLLHNFSGSQTKNLEKYRWDRILGDAAFENSDKDIVLFLKNCSKKIIDVFKWSGNVNFIFPVSDDCKSTSQVDCNDLWLKTEVKKHIENGRALEKTLVVTEDSNARVLDSSAIKSAGVVILVGSAAQFSSFEKLVRAEFNLNLNYLTFKSEQSISAETADLYRDFLSAFLSELKSEKANVVFVDIADAAYLRFMPKIPGMVVVNVSSELDTLSYGHFSGLAEVSRMVDVKEMLRQRQMNPYLKYSNDMHNIINVVTKKLME